MERNRGRFFRSGFAFVAFAVAVCGMFPSSAVAEQPVEVEPAVVDFSEEKLRFFEMKLNLLEDMADEADREAAVEDAGLPIWPFGMPYSGMPYAGGSVVFLPWMVGRVDEGRPVPFFPRCIWYSSFVSWAFPVLFPAAGFWSH